MKELNEIKSQLKDKGINPNGILSKCIEKVILDLIEEVENLKEEINKINAIHNNNIHKIL